MTRVSGIVKSIKVSKSINTKILKWYQYSFSTVLILQLMKPYFLLLTEFRLSLFEIIIIALFNFFFIYKIFSILFFSPNPPTCTQLQRPTQIFLRQVMRNKATFKDYVEKYWLEKGLICKGAAGMWTQRQSTAESLNYHAPHTQTCMHIHSAFSKNTNPTVSRHRQYWLRGSFKWAAHNLVVFLPCECEYDALMFV